MSIHFTLNPRDQNRTIAGQPSSSRDTHGEGDGIPTHIEDRAAGETRLKNPTRALNRGKTKAGVEALRGADVPTENDGPQLISERPKAELVGLEKGAAGCCGHSDDLGCRFQRGSDGLLAQHRFAGVECRDGELRMRGVDRADIHRVDIVALKDLLIGAAHHRASFAGERRCAVGVGAAHGVEVAQSCVFERVREVAADDAWSKNCPPSLTHAATVAERPSFVGRHNEPTADARSR